MAVSSNPRGVFALARLVGKVWVCDVIGQGVTLNLAVLKEAGRDGGVAWPASRGLTLRDRDPGLWTREGRSWI